mgnify:CR=1 FL=1
MFPVVFDHLVGYLLVAEIFTGAVLLTNGGFWSGLVWYGFPGLVWCSVVCVDAGRAGWRPSRC